MGIKALASVEFQGKFYHQYSDRPYFVRSRTAQNPITLHRAVWEHYRGTIPSGHHIHHRFENDYHTTDIERLECLPEFDHLSMHGVEQWEVKDRDKWLAHLATIRPLAAAWHSTEEGLALHRANGKLVWEQFEPETKQCEHCGKDFQTASIGKQDRFCSNACKSSWRRKAGLDNETRQCLECGKTFVCNKYADTACCSRSCGRSRSWRLKCSGL